MQYFFINHPHPSSWVDRYVDRLQYDLGRNHLFEQGKFVSPSYEDKSNKHGGVSRCARVVMIRLLFFATNDRFVLLYRYEYDRAFNVTIRGMMQKDDREKSKNIHRT